MSAPQVPAGLDPLEHARNVAFINTVAAQARGEIIDTIGVDTFDAAYTNPPGGHRARHPRDGRRHRRRIREVVPTGGRMTETPTGRARVRWLASVGAWETTTPDTHPAYFTTWEAAMAWANYWATRQRRQLALRARAAVVPG